MHNLLNRMAIVAIITGILIAFCIPFVIVYYVIVDYPEQKKIQAQNTITYVENHVRLNGYNVIGSIYTEECSRYSCRIDVVYVTVEGGQTFECILGANANHPVCITRNSMPVILD